MGIQSLSIMDAPTSLSVTGGTTQLFEPDGVVVTNGVHIAANAVVDYRVRPHISFANKNPQKKADGTYTLGTRTIKSTEAYLDVVTGKVHYCTTTIETRWSPVMPAAQVKSARYKAAQLLFTANAENYNAVGSLS